MQLAPIDWIVIAVCLGFFFNCTIMAAVTLAACKVGCVRPSRPAPGLG